MGSQAVRRVGARWMTPRSGRVTLALLAAVASTAFLAPTALARTTGAALVDPPANIPRTPAMEQACSAGPGQVCQQAVVGAIDEARAAEGVGPLQLPFYFTSLTFPQQILVLADKERVDRGLPGFMGLSAQLDTLARQGAASNTDPAGPSGVDWGSNWAGGEASALLADYDWMYDDGFGSPNMDCGSPPANGCWDHRRNVLGNYGAHPSIGAAAVKVNGVTSMTELFSSGAAGRLAFVLPKQVPAVVTPSSLQISTAPTVANSAMLTVNDGVGTFRAMAQVAGDKGRWSVTPSCTAHPGQKCHLFVTFVPVRTGMANAMVTVDLPGRTDHVNVSAYSGHGYWEATDRGRIFAYGGGGFRGSAGDIHLARPVVGMAGTPNGGGYWEVAADGGVFSFGNAKFYGSAAELRLKQPVVGMAVANSAKGYWLVSNNGSIYSFGDAKFHGTPAGRAGDNVVAMAATPDAGGYWLVTKTGNVFSFGDARYYGPLAPLHLTQPVVGMAATHDGGGYWMVTRNGTIYSFGDARNYGSPTGGAGNDVVGMAAAATGTGYYVVAANGEISGFGGASSASPGATAHGSQVVAMATA